VTTPTNNIDDLDPRITSDLLNNDPQRWWSGEPAGLLRDAARLAARTPATLPRITPDPREPLRLLFVDREMRENREGRLSLFISAKHEGDLEAKLERHHLLAPYFGRDVHPCTWGALLHHRERTLVINARGGTLPIGSNLVEWGLHDPGDREVRCVCNWEDRHADLETTAHMLFECPLWVNEAGVLRHQRMTMETALGQVKNIQVTSQNPHALQDAMKLQREYITAVIRTWKERNEHRRVALARGRPN